MTKILNGKKLAKIIEENNKAEVLELEKRGTVPSLAIILVGENEASNIYASMKKKAGERMGVKVIVFKYKREEKTENIINKIKKLNNDKKINGIIVQLPLPSSIKKQEVIESVSPQKDVDGFHPLNWGRLAYSINDVMPATASSVLEILHHYNIPIKSKEVVVVGKSEIVGKPLSILLLNEDATLTVVHKETKNLKKHTMDADIIIVAVGCHNLIRSHMIKKGAVIVDVGINRINGKVVGDVDYKGVFDKVAAITPVPGGVGPVTVSVLLSNVILFTQRQINS